MVTKDNDDFPIIRIKEEQNENAWNKVFDLLTDMDYIGVADFFGSYNSGVYGKELEIFVNGNALFMPNALSVLDDEKFVNTEVDYGLVPMPKYSENQTNTPPPLPTGSRWWQYPFQTSKRLTAPCLPWKLWLTTVRRW